MGFVFFRAHTDLADLTDFFVGGKSHGLWVGLCFFGLTQISWLSLIFLTNKPIFFDAKAPVVDDFA